MAEPDFDQIARLVLMKISDNIRGACPPLAFGPVRATLVEVWNARGEADIAKIDIEFADTRTPDVKSLDRALRTLDR